MLQLTDSSVVYRVGQPGERDRAYYAAFKLAASIDSDLTRGICRYRNRAGSLLWELDEVVRAILADDLVVKQAAQ